MKVSTVVQMRQMDRQAIEHYGIFEDLLMENAGHAVYFMILEAFPVLEGKRLWFSAVWGIMGEMALWSRESSIQTGPG